MTSFEKIVNPYWMYKGEPSHICRYIDNDGIRCIAGWDTVNEHKTMPHSKGVIKQANEMNYRLE